MVNNSLCNAIRTEYIKSTRLYISKTDKLTVSCLPSFIMETEYDY